MPTKALSHIGDCTQRYEAWLASHIPLIQADVRLKHAQMKEALFPFMRATYYRWAEVWPEVCGHAGSAPEALSVGDLHIENFGTWRDTEGRLVASANMAIDANHIALDSKGACEAVLAGYQKGLEAGGRPFVLAEEHAAL